MSLENENSSNGKSPEIDPKLKSVKGSLGARAAAMSRKPSEPDSETDPEDSGSGLKLKKPSSPLPEKKLHAPSMQLKKPGESNGSGRAQLKKPGESGNKLSLKKPSQLAAEESNGPSHSLGLTKPNDFTLPEDLNKGPVLETKSTPGSEPESKLTQPGNLQLKKNATSTPKKAEDSSSGLRLRIPSESPSPEDQVSEETAENNQENVKTESDEDSKGSEISLKLKKKDKKEKLGLAKPEEKHESGLTPPGDEPSQESESQKDPGENSAFTQPVEKVKFARKKKSNLTSKQKKLITFMGAPVIIVFLVLGFMFLSKFFFSIPTKDKSSQVESGKKPKPKKETKKPKEKNKSKKGIKLRFPDELLTQLEEEYGVEGKKQFLEEWSRLSNREKKDYLIEINAWNNEEEPEKQ